MQLFTPMELEATQDQRGNPRFIGRARLDGDEVEVQLPRGLTSVRFDGPRATTHARLLPRVRIEEDGTESLVYRPVHVTRVGG